MTLRSIVRVPFTSTVSPARWLHLPVYEVADLAVGCARVGLDDGGVGAIPSLSVDSYAPLLLDRWYASKFSSVRFRNDDATRFLLPCVNLQTEAGFSWEGLVYSPMLHVELAGLGGIYEPWNGTQVIVAVQSATYEYLPTSTPWWVLDTIPGSDLRLTCQARSLEGTQHWTVGLASGMFGPGIAFRLPLGDPPVLPEGTFAKYNCWPPASDDCVASASATCVVSRASPYDWDE